MVTRVSRVSELKKAEKIFNEKGYTWQAVVETFVEKELTEQDALINAQLARILTTDDYDHEKKRTNPLEAFGTVQN